MKMERNIRLREVVCLKKQVHDDNKRIRQDMGDNDNHK